MGKYVTVSRVIPMIANLRTGMMALIAAAEVAGGEQHAQKMIYLVQHLLEDFNNRWGDGSNITAMWMEGPRRQPQGFLHTHVLATALDPRTRDLQGVPAGEHEAVWALVTKYLAELILEERAAAAAHTQPQAPEALNDAAAAIAPEDPNYDSGDEIRKRIEALQQALQVQQHKKIWEQHNIDVNTVATHCVAKFKEWRNGGIIAMERDPLKCWKQHDEAEDWGPLSKLASMVLAAPASSAPVERVFSEGALIASKRRQCMQHENVSLMLFLHNGWDKVREFRLSSAAGE